MAVAIQYLDFDCFCEHCGARLVLPPAQPESPCALPENPHCPRGCGPADDEYVPRWPVQIPFS